MGKCLLDSCIPRYYLGYFAVVSAGESGGLRTFEVILRDILCRLVTKLVSLFRANGKSLLLHQLFVFSDEVLEGVRYMEFSLLR